MTCRIRLNLGQFFTDHRSDAFIVVREDFKSICELQEHIIKVFGLDCDIYLTDDGVYLPSAERSNVIKNGSLICVNKLLVKDLNTANVPESSKESDENDTQGKKRKRTRKRKPKNSYKPDASENDLNLPATTYAAPSKKSKKHILFDDTEQDSEEQVDVKSEIRFSEPEYPREARVIKAELVGSRISSILERAGRIKESGILPIVMEKLDNLLPDLEDVLQVPKKNETIIFKIYESNNDLTPFMMGIIHSVEGKNTLKIQILCGEENITSKSPQNELYSFEFDELVAAKKYHLI